jgi:tRNA nucleotidyltransferase/poly(A) polymerase
VRDLLLGLEPKDYDIATDATPEQVHAVFRRSRIIGRRFQIVHVMFGGDLCEVSTFRAMQGGGERLGHHRIGYGDRSDDQGSHRPGNKELGQNDGRSRFWPTRSAEDVTESR